MAGVERTRSVAFVADESLAFALPGAERFAAVDWEWDAEVPALADLAAYFRCVSLAVKHHGDHAMVIGEVTPVEITPYEPLAYLRRRMDWRVQPAARGGPRVTSS